MSCSTSQNFSAGWDGSGNDKVLFELKFTPDVPALVLQEGRRQSGDKYNSDGEQEVILSRGQKWHMTGYRWQHNQHVITMESVE
jgi:hypothetical protein